MQVLQSTLLWYLHPNLLSKVYCVCIKDGTATEHLLSYTEPMYFLGIPADAPFTSDYHLTLSVVPQSGGRHQISALLKLILIHFSLCPSQPTRGILATNLNTQAPRTQKSQSYSYCIMGNTFSQFFFIPSPSLTEKNCPDQAGRVSWLLKTRILTFVSLAV